LASISASTAFSRASELASSGLPEGREKEILEELRDKAPPRSSTPFKNPVAGNPQAVRDNLREADRLLKEAGFEVKNGKRVNAKGEALTIEFLGDDPTFERFVCSTSPRWSGSASASICASWTLRSMRTGRATSISTPSAMSGAVAVAGQRAARAMGFGGGGSAGLDNLIGIKDAGIDALIDKVIFAKDRADLVAATRALDRVLLAHDFVVPQWT
jgi:microcin C transport system substrate-binding protein